MNKAIDVQSAFLKKDKASDYPSGRGHAGGSAGSHRIDNPDRRTGKLPLHHPLQKGAPSSSPDVTASQIMQNVIMNDDDIEWYDELFKKQSKKFLTPRFSVKPGFDVGLNCGPKKEVPMNECLGCVTNLCTKHLNEGKKDLLLEPDSAKKKKKKKKNESNAVAGGGISGHMGDTRKQKKNDEFNARAFGGGKMVGKR